MNKHLAPIALSVGLLGIVGGVAAAHTFQPAPVKREVQVVQPASQVVAPSPTTTTPVVTATTVVTATATPKPVQSVKAKAPAPAPVQRQAVVATADPAPAQTAPSAPTPGQPLVLDPGNAPNGQFGPGQGTPPPTK